jgi:hypothetical protein
MGSIRENLSLLGLPDDASLEQANEAYKDLIRVWHPDRFQSDPRLKKKAESESQKFNHAIRELRRLFKEPREKDAKKRRSSRRGTKRPHPSEHRSPPSRSPTYTFPLPNFALHHSPRTSIQRALLGVALVAVGTCMAINAHGRSPVQEALGIILVSGGLSGLLLNALLLITRRPLFSMKNGALFAVGLPTIPVAQIASASAFQRAYGPTLGITLDRAFLGTIPQPIRLILAIRHFVSRRHIEVDFSRLSYHPAEVITLLQHAIVLSPANHSPQKAPTFVSLSLAHGLTVLVTIVMVARCFIGPPLSLLGYIPFVIILIVTRSVVAYRSVMCSSTD